MSDTATAPEAPSLEAPGSTAPEQTPKEAPEFASSSDPDFAAAFDYQEDGLRVEPKKSEKPAEAKPPADPQKADAPKEEPQAKEEPKEDAPKDDKVDPNDSRLPKGFRKELQRVSTERDAVVKERDSLKQRLAQLEKTSGDSQAMSKVMETQKGEIQKLQERLSQLQFVESEDFKNKFEKPFDKAKVYAKQVIEELEVIETDGDDMQSTRPATWNDLVELYGMKTAKQYEAVNRMFGPAAPAVMEQLQTLRRLERDMEAAKTEELGAWKEKQESERANRAASEQKIQEAWSKVNDEIAQKHPDWFEESEDDPKANELQKSAVDIADHYFNNRHTKMKAEDIMLIEAQMRNRFIAVPRLQRRINAQASEIEQLKAKIAEFEGSDPNTELKRPGGGPGPKPAIDDPEREFRPLLEGAFTS